MGQAVPCVIGGADDRDDSDGDNGGGGAGTFFGGVVVGAILAVVAMKVVPGMTTKQPALGSDGLYDAKGVAPMYR
jgi:hypothetical protein